MHLYMLAIFALWLLQRLRKEYYLIFQKILKKDRSVPVLSPFHGAHQLITEKEAILPSL